MTSPLRMTWFLLLAAMGTIPPAESAQQVSGQDIDQILDRADKLLEEAKGGYEEASAKGSVSGFVDAGFKLEEARIKYLVLQEIGSAEKQKIAADRLRAVNQLTKLIHDGKVAITGKPAEGVPAKPADPAPDVPAVPQRPPKPADVLKRAALPDAAKQKEAEKTIKDLFKEQYAKKAVADRKALARLLLNQAARSQEDPAAAWVLCREAQDVAAQVCDVPLVLEAVEAASRSFDVDAAAMRGSALAASAKSARTPEEFAALFRAFMSLTDELARSDQFESAEKAAASAVQHARNIKDPELISRATTRAKEIAEARTLHQSMKSVMAVQARNPDDPAANLEIGRFLCFVKGAWDLGLRFMVKGSDPVLKSLAEKELAFPAQVGDRVALADGWYDLAEKEKSPLKKTQLLAHAKGIYESALPDAVALVRARIEKRLSELESVGPAVARVDLLKTLDPKKDAVHGAWKLENQALVSPMEGFARILLPYVPPAEYDLTLLVERKGVAPDKTAGGLYVGLVANEKQFGAEIDAGLRWTGIWLSEGGGSLGPKVQDNSLTEGRTHTIVYKVRTSKVEIRVNGAAVIDWSADYSRVWTHPGWRVPDSRVIYLGAHKATYSFKQVTLQPVSGTGKPTR